MTLEAFMSNVEQFGIQCHNKLMMMPYCTHLIPGVTKSGSLMKHIIKLRDEIEKLTIKRYNRTGLYKYGLYPYLEKDEFMWRQRYLGQEASKDKVRHLLDIGSYYNPIHLFMNHCPETVTIVEPILDPLSVRLPCPAGHTGARVQLVHFLPIAFKDFATDAAKIQETIIPSPDGVVCIGCDFHYGPSQQDMKCSFKRPYRVYLEYPASYLKHLTPWPFVMTKSPGVKLLVEKERVVVTNEKGAFKERRSYISDFGELDDSKMEKMCGARERWIHTRSPHFDFLSNN